MTPCQNKVRRKLILVRMWRVIIVTVNPILGPRSSGTENPWVACA